MIARRAPGSLEAEILAILWASDAALSAQEVRRQLPGDLAHTTVNTILTRLHEKGAVDRELEGRGYVYRPVLDQAGIAAQRMRALLDDEADSAGVLSHFVAGLDGPTLRALRRAIGGGTGGDRR